MNHRLQNHVGAHKATANLDQMENTEVQMPTNCNIDAHLADHRVVMIQLASPHVAPMPASEQIEYVCEADLADRRVEIQRDDRLKLALQEWEKDLQKVQVAIQYKRAHSTNVKSELYQLVCFYIVFQGVVLTAVAQGSLLRCQTCWGPASLSLLASIATVPAVHDRLKDYISHKDELFREGECSNVIAGKIGMLKRRGASFKFEELAGMQGDAHSGERKQQFNVRSRKNHIVKWLTTLLLCVFSSIVLSCCYFIPCWGSIDNTSAVQIAGSPIP